MASFFTSLVAFISTNIDDIFILMILFAQTRKRTERNQIALGQFLGISILTTFSLLGACGLQLIPRQYTGLLGFVPIFLGIKAWIEHSRETEEDSPEIRQGSRVISVAMITIANGADNIGVYIPLFAGYTLTELCLAVMIFAGMTFLWCFLADSLSRLPGIRRIIEKYKHILIPVVFILLGIYILLASGIF